MISLKRYIDSAHDELTRCTLEAYRNSIAAAAAFGSQACPPIADKFSEALDRLRQQLEGQITAETINATGQGVATNLQEWGAGASEYFQRTADEVKEVMEVLAKTAEAVGERDHRYAGRFSEFSKQLRTIAGLEDISRIRKSLLDSAQQLKDCVEQMSEDSRKAVLEMRAKIQSYESKLEAEHEAATHDELTGLENRRSGQAALEKRIEMRTTFCVLMFDLNGFKAVNDTYGHAVGDELLKEFGKELKGAFRLSDVVVRWGGDEFIVLLDCQLGQAQSKLDQVRNWVFGDYPLKVGEETKKIHVAAASGVVAWLPGETCQHLLERADAAMYKDKKVKR